MANDNNTIMRVSITKEELAALPAAHYTEGAVVIDSEKELTEAVDHLRHARIVGFDTETRPTFRRGQSNHVSLLQLASPDAAYLFRLNTLGLHPELVNLLEDPDVLKVGLSLRDDFLSLSRIGKVEPQGFVDLQQDVKDYKIQDNSLSRIYGILFGERIPKGQRLTNWEAPNLTEAQINYAAFDAISCIRIYDYIHSGAFNPDASPYMREMEAPKPPAPKDPDAPAKPRRHYHRKPRKQ